MGKDREGNYHPPKGKPSGSGQGHMKEVNLKDEKAVDDYLTTADKYTEGENEDPSGVQIRHPNRNVNKNRSDGNATKRQSSSTEFSEDTGVTEVVADDAITDLTSGDMSLRELARQLAEDRQSKCVSIYVEKNKEEDALKPKQELSSLQTSLQRARTSLLESGISESAAELILMGGKSLANDEAFWSRVDKGVAIFMSEDFFRVVNLPAQIGNAMYVGNAFHIVPLLEHINEAAAFYLLVLSKKQAKLFIANQFSITPLVTPELPNGIDDVVHLEEKEGQDLFRTGSSGDGGGANYHGAGEGQPDDKENIALYLEEVDKTLRAESYVKDDLPLILCGVEYLLPIFKSVSKYKDIYDQYLTGSFEHEKLAVLHEKALAIAQPLFQQDSERAWNAFSNALGSDRVSMAAREIVAGAFFGRVETLFVCKGSHLWGGFDPQNDVMTIHDQKQEGDQCLINAAVTETLAHGGRVYFKDAENMAEQSVMAALMRFSL